MLRTIRRSCIAVVGVITAAAGLAVVPPTAGSVVPAVGAQVRVGAIESLPGCTDNELARNDDGSTAAEPIGFTVDFFGETYDSVFVNNNGNVTFDAALSTFTPFDLSTTDRVIVAPFFADVDTRGDLSRPVTYGQTQFDGRPAFCVQWFDVGYFSGNTDKLNRIQLLLVDRSTPEESAFDIIFNYDRIEWETGDSSGGTDGLGGDSARAGYSSGQPENSFEIEGSGVPGSFLDGAESGLVHNSIGSEIDGRYVFVVRGGNPVPAGADLVPENLAGPDTIVSGTPTTFTWTVRNTGESPAVGPWTEQVLLIRSPDNRPSTVALPPVEVDPADPLDPGESIDVQVTTVVPGTVPGRYFLSVHSNIGRDVAEPLGNNEVLDDTAIDVSLPVVVVDGAPATVTMDGDVLRASFEIVGGTGPVALRVDSTGVTGMLTVAEGMVPTRGAQDHSLDFTDGGSQLVVPPPGGRLFVTVERQSGAGPVTVEAVTAGVVVAEVSPSTAGADAPITFSLRGSGLEGVERFVVRDAAGTEAEAGLVRERDGVVSGLVDLTGLTGGPASVEVFRVDGATATAVDSVTVVAEGTEDVVVRLTGPEALRLGRETVYQLEFANLGSADAPMQLLQIPAPADVEIRTRPGGRVRDTIYLFTAFSDVGDARFPAGRTGSLPLYVTSRTTSPVTLGAYAYDVGLDTLAAVPVDWDAVQAASTQPASMDDDAWDAFWDTIESRLGTNWQTLSAGLADHAVALATDPRFPDRDPGIVDSLQALLQEIDAARLAVQPAPAPARRDATRPIRLRTGGNTGASTGTIRVASVALQDYEALDPENPNLPNTADDQENWVDYLTEESQVPPSSFVAVANDPVGSAADFDRTDMQQVLQDLADGAGPEDTIFFHYSGHGLPNAGPVVPGGLQMTGSSDGESIGDVLNWDQLIEPLNASEAKQIVVVLDSCYSGGFVDHIQGRYDTTIGATGPDAVNPERWLIGTATTGSQKSYDFVNGGTYTKEMLRLLDATDGDVAEALDAANGMRLGTGFLGGDVAEQAPTWVPGMHTQNPTSFNPYYSSLPLVDETGALKDEAEDELDEDDPDPDDHDTEQDEEEVETVRSFDPNEKTTVGVGDGGYLAPGQTDVPYTIHFENDPALGATAPVQELLVTDSLPVEVDWSTATLGDLRFGSTTVTVPPGQVDFATIVTPPNDPEHPVRITATLDRTTGEVEWLLRSVEAGTNLLPADATAGFLEVEDGSGAGQGWVGLHTELIDGLPSGTRIENQAIITFDPSDGANAPIVTNVAVNTVDLDPPSSAITPLPAESPDPVFVSWTGSDAVSGVESYTVSVSVDNGPFTVWLADTTSTSASYDGEVGETVAFSVTAIDRVGLAESKTPVAEATTEIVPGGGGGGGNPPAPGGGTGPGDGDDGDGPGDEEAEDPEEDVEVGGDEQRRPVQPISTHRRDRIARLYDAVMGRTAETRGLDYWEATELSVEEIAALFLISAEFERRFGSVDGNEALVRLLYRNILGRDGESSGIGHWTGVLAAGVSRSVVVVAFADSDELIRRISGCATVPITQSRVDRIDRLFRVAFGRPAGSSLAYWSGTGLALPDMAVAFAATDEFAARFGALADDAFVASRYEQVLGRSASAFELAVWSGLLAAGMSRGEVAWGIAESREHLHRLCGY